MAGVGFQPELCAVQVKEFTSTEDDVSTSAQILRGELGNIQQQDHMGRWGHLIGFEVTSTVQFDINATTLSAAVDGRRLYELMDQWKLRAGGVDHIGPDIDGKRLRDDYAIRNGMLAVDDPADLADAATANATQVVRWRYLFGGPQLGMERNGMLPLVMIDHKVDGNDRLEFRLATGISGLAAAQGVTFDGFANVRIYAILIYSARPVLDAGWFLREDTETNLQGTVEPVFPDRDTRCEYAVIRHTDTDTNGVDVDSDYSGTFDVRCGGYQLVSGLDVSEMRSLARLSSEAHWGGARHLRYDTEVDLERIPLMEPRPGTQRSELGRAPIHWRTTARSNKSTTRILHRQIFEHTDAWRIEAARRMGYPAGSAAENPGAPRDISPKLLPRQLVKNVPKPASAVRR